MPIGGAHIWAWFWELDAGRGYTAWGSLSSISHVQIAAWASITGITIRRHELEIILAMDRARLQASSPEHIEARAASNAQPMTPGLFRAMFGKGDAPPPRRSSDGDVPGAKDLVSSLKALAQTNGKVLTQSTE